MPALGNLMNSCSQHIGGRWIEIRRSKWYCRFWFIYFFNL